MSIFCVNDYLFFLKCLITNLTSDFPIIALTLMLLYDLEFIGLIAVFAFYRFIVDLLSEWRVHNSEWLHSTKRTFCFFFFIFHLLSNVVVAPLAEQLVAFWMVALKSFPC